LWLRFKGGIGLAKLAGAVLAAGAVPALIAVPALALFWIFLMKVVGVHRARATIFVVPLGVPFLWWLGMPWPGLITAGFGALLVILKTLPDWNRVYNH
jgi:glycerol-3-phosphate acyltransferase PlsY